MRSRHENGKSASRRACDHPSRDDFRFFFFSRRIFLEYTPSDTRRDWVEGGGGRGGGGRRKVRGESRERNGVSDGVSEAAAKGWYP